MRKNLFEMDWFHGTEKQFKRWIIPPPQHLEKGVQHCGSFFTTDLGFASKAGNSVASVRINSSSKILDTINHYKLSEKLRQNLVQKNPLFSSLENSKIDIWHDGWRDGSVLRPIIQTDSLADRHIGNLIHDLSRDYGIEVATQIAHHNATRGLIEIICAEVKKMGFDGIYGHEIDRWDNTEIPKAVPLLCILNSKVILKTEWIR